MKNMGLIYYGSISFPPNRGVKQVVHLLDQLDINTFIVSRSKNTTKALDDYEGHRVIYLPLQDGKSAFDYSYPFPFNPYWSSCLLSLARKHKWRGMIVRETPVAWQALNVGQKLSIPVFLDLRENLAAMYQKYRQRNPLESFFKKPFFVNGYEKRIMHRFDHIFTSTKELAEWVGQKYMTNRKKISVLENTPHESYIEDCTRALSQIDTEQRRQTRIVYAGQLSKEKGIFDILLAMPLVLDRLPSVVLRIIGDGPAQADLEKKVAEMGLERNVEFLPMLSMHDLAFALAECSLGVESSRPDPHTNQTVPGKLFEYMAAGLPLLSSPRVPIKRILAEYDCGRIYDSFSTEDIAGKMLGMLDDKEELERMGKNARNAVISRFNWRHNLEVVREVLKGNQIV